MTINPEIMDTFIKLVRQMRVKQMAYFANRNQHSLIEAKSAERTVDGWLNHFTEVKFFEDGPKQISLFGKEGKP